MKKSLIFLLLLPLLAFKCEKEPPMMVEPPVQDTTVFPFHFVFINKGTMDFTLLNVESYFYNSRVDSSYIRTELYLHEARNIYRMTGDTIIHSSYSVSSGSKALMKIAIGTTDQWGRSKGVYDLSSYPMGETGDDWGKVITSWRDTMEVFVWPDDTARYVIDEYTYRED